MSDSKDVLIRRSADRKKIISLLDLTIEASPKYAAELLLHCAAFYIVMDKEFGEGLVEEMAKFFHEKLCEYVKLKTGVS